ncbi:PREDICTED: receptor [Prunus dulcis]|uniref:PREDICTED: receptor n=1 Tax=Prunus dulcis TaxID=3755 RepID=A0A5E4G615_PRUDU|nr:hypothetical protein L3X38_024178 [Prunus dulcis]VVA35255.1 PREDICTED: receptor [Prunus dulcis]
MEASVSSFTQMATPSSSNNTLLGRSLKTLKGLNFSHNELTSTIPSSFGDIYNLEWLDLSSNRLVGDIPEQLTNLTSLEKFNVSKNRLVGPHLEASNLIHLKMIHIVEIHDCMDCHFLKHAVHINHRRPHSNKRMIWRMGMNTRLACASGRHKVMA